MHRVSWPSNVKFLSLQWHARADSPAPDSASREPPMNPRIDWAVAVRRSARHLASVLLLGFLLVSPSPARAQQNSTTHYAYDALNRLTDITYPTAGEDIAYAYDTGESPRSPGRRGATPTRRAIPGRRRTSRPASRIPAGVSSATPAIHWARSRRSPPAARTSSPAGRTARTGCSPGRPTATALPTPAPTISRAA